MLQYPFFEKKWSFFLFFVITGFFLSLNFMTGCSSDPTIEPTPEKIIYHPHEVIHRDAGSQKEQIIEQKPIDTPKEQKHDTSIPDNNNVNDHSTTQDSSINEHSNTNDIPNISDDSTPEPQQTKDHSHDSLVVFDYPNKVIPIHINITNTSKKDLYIPFSWSSYDLLQIQHKVSGKWTDILTNQNKGMCFCRDMCTSKEPACKKIKKTANIWVFGATGSYSTTWHLSFWQKKTRQCSDGTKPICYDNLKHPAPTGDYRFRLCFALAYSPSNAKKDPNNPSIIRLATPSGKITCKDISFSLPKDAGQTFSLSLP